MKEGTRVIGIGAPQVENNATRNATVYDKRIHIAHPELLSSSHFVLISTRRKEAGRALLGAIDQSGAPIGVVAVRLHVPSSILEGFGEGNVALDPKEIYHAASYFVYEEIPEMKKLQTIIEEERLMRTLTRNGITIARAAQFLRLNTLQTRLDFANKAQLSESHLGQIELGHREPKLSTVNQIITAAGLDTLGMPAQLLRLLVEKRDPMTLTGLQTCTYGELFKYLRQLRGFPQATLAQRMKDEHGSMDQSTIKDIEKGRIIRPKKVETFIRAIDLDPESELAETIRIKAHTPINAPQTRIPEETVQRVFSSNRDGQFLFAENLLEIGNEEEKGSKTLVNALTMMRSRLINAGNTKKVLGSLLLKLRTSKHLSQQKVTQATERITKADLWRIEKGDQLPLDVTVAKLLKSMGYDMQSQVAWFFIDTLNLMQLNLS